MADRRDAASALLSAILKGPRDTAMQDIAYVRFGIPPTAAELDAALNRLSSIGEPTC